MCIYKKREGYFQRKKKEIGLPAFRPTEKSRSSLPDWRSQLTDDTEEYFKPLLKKKEAQLRKKAVSHKLIHPVLHPYLNSSVHFAQFSADPDDTPNMTRS